MSFTSFNGTVDVTLPGDVKANVMMKTNNGEIWSDFDIKLTAGGKPPVVEDNRGTNGKYKLHLDRAMYGTINGGGPEMQFVTYNGSILIHKKYVVFGGGFAVPGFPSFFFQFSPKKPPLKAAAAKNGRPTRRSPAEAGCKLKLAPRYFTSMFRVELAIFPSTDSCTTARRRYLPGGASRFRPALMPVVEKRV